MIRTLLVPAVLLVLAGTAIAQPGQPPGPPPPPPGTGPVVQPPPPQPYYQPQPGYQPPAPQYVAMGPQHDGFTIGLDIGFGLTNGESNEGGDASTESGLSGLNLTLGSFINPQMAIAFRLSGTAFWVDGFGDDIMLTNSFAGGIVQFWATPQLFVGGGLGVAIFTAPLEDNVDAETGFAVSGRVGYEFSQSSSSGFHAALEVTPSFYDGFRVVSVGFQVGWQHY